MAAGSQHSEASGRPAPLAGMRVVELATFVSGPYATMMLADLGAEVVKVEPAAGDPFRRFGRPATEYSVAFATSNRGKRSVVLDLKSADGVGKLHRLLAASDILVCNWRPGVAERLGLGDDLLAGANQKLIRIYITGFGADGPLRDEPAFDTVVQGRSGMTRALSPSDTPVLLPGYPVDKLTAIMAVQAALAAVVGRQRDGRGERIDLAMLDVAGYFNFVDLYSNRAFVDSQPDDPRHLYGMAARPIAASDGWLVIAPVSAAAIRGACRAVGQPEWGDQLLAIRDQVALVHELLSRIESVTRTAPVVTWLERFGQEDIPISPCLSIDEHLEDPQVSHNHLYRVGDWPSVGRVRSVRYPARFTSTVMVAPDGEAPPLGADTEQLIADAEGAPSP